MDEKQLGAEKKVQGPTHRDKLPASYTARKGPGVGPGMHTGDDHERETAEHIRRYFGDIMHVNKDQG
jgi:hypothetical protein